MKKRFASLLLALLMCLSAPLTAWAVSYVPPTEIGAVTVELTAPRVGEAADYTARVDADAPRRQKKVRVQIKPDAARLVVQKSQRRDRAGRQLQKILQFLRRGEAERPRTVRFAEFLEIYAFVAADGDEIIVSLFVVADEEILRVRRRIGQVDRRKLGHVEDRAVLGDLVGNAVVCKITV